MSIRKRTGWFTVIVGIAIIALVGVAAGPSAAAVHRTYSYEYGLDGWQKGFDGGGAWHMTRSTDEAYTGAYSIECFIDGTAGMGTAWMMRSYTVPFDTLVDVRLTVQLYSHGVSDVNQSAVLGYFGTTPPTGRADFQTIGYTNMVAGWHGYQISGLQLTGQYPARIWVAYGVATTWESTVEYYMDHVTVSVTP